MSHQFATQSARDHARAEARLELAEAMLRIIKDMEEAEQPVQYMLGQLKLHLDTVKVVEEKWLTDTTYLNVSTSQESK